MFLRSAIGVMASANSGINGTKDGAGEGDRCVGVASGKSEHFG